MSTQVPEYLLDIYDRAEEIAEALDEIWPDIGAVVNSDIREQFESAFTALRFIRHIVEDQVGGLDRLSRLRYERENAGE